MARHSIRSITTDPAAVARLAALGVSIFVHGRVYGLVADASRPSGHRLVGEARSVAALERKLTRRLEAQGKL